ncbi:MULTISPECIES: SDR family oxidoreductase [Paenibacillus]|uniref:SDR family oxidoreductase n=1 Tax=Paenibacillus TaxID=44249 RepID=UPI0003F58DE4|nr:MULTISPECIES: SDR family oxidoreductase [Paenibacillus]CDN42278.1 Estradiol 17-beta-dehydrogenase 1 [Paenibacillus sp. P22]
MSKAAAITGASSGIGLASALKLASEGVRVYAGTRNLERDSMRHAGTANLTFLEMEVTDPASLERAFRTIEEEQGRLDLLFCNAGFGCLRALGQAEMADIERVFDTNVYGVMNTIRAALPLLRRSGQGYIMTTSSVGGLVGQPFNEIYCASKFAVEGLMESLATYYKPAFNIDITLLEPGAIATEFTGTVMNHLQQTGGILEDEYKPILTRYMDNFAARTSVPQTSESVAEVVWSLVQAADKPLRIRTSEAAEAFARFKTEQDPTGLIGLKNTRRLHLNIDEEQ